MVMVIMIRAILIGLTIILRKDRYKMKYKVRYFESYEGYYEVEALSKEQAEEIVVDNIGEGKMNAPEECFDSGAHAELLDMRYENLIIQNLDLSGKTWSYECLSTDELIEAANNIRREKGYNDLVSAENDNEVYYNFYLQFTPDSKQLELIATCNNGEKDDRATYSLPVTPKEKEILLFKTIKALLNESD